MMNTNTNQIIKPVDNTLLILGEASTGKTTSLSFLKEPEKTLFFNFEGKALPFRSDMHEIWVIDEFEDFLNYIDAIIDNPEPFKEKFNYIVIDSVTSMMDLAEQYYVINSRSSNGYKGWSDYKQFFLNLITKKFAKIPVNIIILGHLKITKDDETRETVKKSPISTSIKDVGIEAYFTTIVYAEKRLLKDIKVENPLLDKEDCCGFDKTQFKYVFVTQAREPADRIRSPLKMWKRDELYIDSNAQYVFDRMDQYFNKNKTDNKAE